MNEIATISAEKYLVTYRKMQAAIATCHAVDECAHINDHAERLSAYFIKAKDDEAVRLFHEIKLRSWRKMGQIIISLTDFTGRKTKNAQVTAVIEQLKNYATISQMKRYQITQALAIGALPEVNFEKFLRDAAGNLYAIISLADPVMIERREKQAKEREEYLIEFERTRPQREAAEAEQRKIEAEKFAEMARQEALLISLVADEKDASDEVGLSFKKVFKKDLKRTILYLQPELHAALRQAHFDKRLTMQEILRRGLKLWLSANGYDG